MLHRLVVSTSVFILLTGSGLAEENRPVVSLLLPKASAERQDKRVLFRCDAVLENSGPNEIATRTNFNSLFDGLELVVTTSDGKILVQQAYIFSRSPNKTPPGDIMMLPRGGTETTLAIPIYDLPTEVATFKVRLVGKLMNSDYKRILSSETLEIKVK